MNQSEPNGEPQAIAEPEAIARDAATTWVTEPRTESAPDKGSRGRGTHGEADDELPISSPVWEGPRAIKG